MCKNFITLVLVMVSVGCGFYMGKLAHSTPVQPLDPEIIYLDSLIKDTLYLVNDSIDKEINDLDSDKKEAINNLISASDSANLLFFSKYIESYNNK